jgi:hypothetical protein
MGLGEKAGGPTEFESADGLNLETGDKGADRFVAGNEIEGLLGVRKAGNGVLPRGQHT